MRTAVDLATGEAVDQSVFAAACKVSGLVVSRVDLLLQGAQVARLDVSAGSVQFNRGAGLYARLTGLEVDASPEDLPTRQGGRLTPSGWEVRVWAGLRLRAVAGSTLAVWLTTEGDNYLTDEFGVVLTDGEGHALIDVETAIITDEAGNPIYVDEVVVPGTGVDFDAVVALGTFPLESAQVDAFGSVGVDGWDRSATVAADLLTETLTWPGDFTTIEDAVDDLIRRTFPNISTSFTGTTHPCPVQSYERDAKPWDIVKEAAKSVGCWARFDGYGNFLWSPEPDQSTAEPEVEFVEGPGGTLSDITATVANRDVYNSWTVTGANPAEAGTDFTATVYDDSPDSETRWNGPYGRRPKPSVRMELVDSQAKADEAVRAMRAAEIGLGVELAMTVVPHYLVEPGDAFTVVREAAGVDGVALVESQTISLAPGAMSLGARARQVTGV